MTTLRPIRSTTPRRLAAASLAAAAALALTAPGSAAIVDLSGLTGEQTTGEDLVASYDVVSQTSTADFFLDSTQVNIAFSLTGDPRFNASNVKDRPNLRISDDGLGIDSGLPNSTDTTFRLDETPDGSIAESFTFVFDTPLVLSAFGLADFGSITDNTGTRPKAETIIVSVAGVDVATIASNDAQVTANQTIAGDPGIALIDLDTPLTLAPGTSLSFRVGDDGDGNYSGSDRSAVLLQSLDLAVPEPGSLLLTGLGAGLLLWRRR